jgi:hypothetical protein
MSPLEEQFFTVGRLHAVLLFKRGNALVEDSTWLELRQRGEATRGTAADQGFGPTT